jgi:hypothetical protein
MMIEIQPGGLRSPYANRGPARGRNKPHNSRRSGDLQLLEPDHRPVDTPQIELDLVPGSMALARLPHDAPVPAWTEEARRFISVTRTPDELSILADAEVVPSGAAAVVDFRALRVRGPLALDQVGVMASLATPLAAAGVAIFTIATHDTDWLLLRESNLLHALEALRRAGHRVHEE